MAKSAASATRRRQASPPPARPFGSALADFGRLSPAERKLLECCRNGVVADIAPDLPQQKSRANSVRAEFVRFLALGGDEDAPVHDHGVQLSGAWVVGRLDLSMSDLERPFGLWRCQIERIEAWRSRLVQVDLSGSRLADGFYGGALRCEGDIVLADGFHASGEVRLSEAQIGGRLHCSGARFGSPSGYSLICDRLLVGASVILREMTATGRVAFYRARIGDDLDCSHAALDGGSNAALVLDRSSIDGSVFLRGSRALGGVRMDGARIGCDLDCSGAAFANESGETLSCDEAEVTGAFVFRGVDAPGRIDLASMRVGTLLDDAESWRGAHELVLEDFRYDRLAGPAPADAAMRIAWLRLQPAEHLGRDFRRQPWAQLIAVLRAMGRGDEARTVAIARETLWRRAGRIPFGMRPLHWVYGLMFGYGYRPMRLVATVALVWVMCALAYWAAVNPQWFGTTTHLLRPAEREPGAACLVARAAARRGDPCPVEPPDYRNFVPLIYSANVLVPAVSLGYSDQWQPVVSDREGKPLLWGQILRLIYWLEMFFGFFVSLILAGRFGNLFKTD